MTVYVDDVRHRYGRMIMCHMWADDLDELHAMADRIGVARRWFQKPPKASWEHYDICLAKKAEAVKLGAVLMDRYAAYEHTQRLKLAGLHSENAKGNLARIAAWRRKKGLPGDGIVATEEAR